MDSEREQRPLRKFQRRELRVGARVDTYGNEDLAKTKADYAQSPWAMLLAALSAWRGVTSFAGRTTSFPELAR